MNLARVLEKWKNDDMIDLLLKQLKKNNLSWKVELLAPYFKKKEKILDFGCGDLTMVKSLKEKCPSSDISGVDIVNNQSKVKNVPFFLYDGSRLPFGNEAFDTVIAFYVFHHCQSAQQSFSECLRVAKGRLIFIEAVPRNNLEIYLMRLMDWLYNLWKPEAIPLTYQFLFLKKWNQIFRENKVKSATKKEVRNTPFAFLPIGQTFLFEVLK